MDLNIHRGYDHFYGSLRVGDNRFTYSQHDDGYGDYYGGNYPPYSSSLLSLYGPYRGIDYSRYGYHGCKYPYYSGYYYHRYRPLCYPWYNDYSPCYGYGYSSVYYPYPYYYGTYLGGSYYAPGVTYAETTAGTVVYDVPPSATAAAETQPVEVPPAPSSAESGVPADVAPGWAPILIEGSAAFAAGRFEEARQLYIRAVLIDERDGYAKMLYAWSNFALGEYELAATAIRRAMLTTPELIDYPIDVRTLYDDALTFEAHLHVLQLYAIDHPEQREAQLVLAYLHYSVGDPEQAALILDGYCRANSDDNVAALLRDAAVRRAQEISKNNP